jgi:biopolymer transport protein ExbB
MSADSAVLSVAVDPFAFWAIIAASVVLCALAGEQLFRYWRLVQDARDLGVELGKALYRADLAAARTLCERSTSWVADVFVAALNKTAHPQESPQKAAERERLRLGLRLRRRLWAIGTVGAVAPFVGLFGTVVGIIRAFRDIASAGAMGFPVVARGGSEALVATAGGIGVAVVAVVLYNYFQSRANEATVEIRLVVDEFLEQLEGHRAAPRAER